MNPNVLIKIQDIETGQIYDISNAISKLTITFYRKGQSNKLTAKFHNEAKVYIPKGSKIMVIVNGKSFYKGYYAENNIDMWNDTDATFYDQLNYLVKNKWSYNFTGMTATQILKRIAADFKLVVGECEETGYAIGNGNYPNFNMSLMDMISKALTHTLYNTGRLYNLREDYGYLKITSPLRMVAENTLITGSNILGFKFNGSINKNTYNKINILYDSSGQSMIGPSAIAKNGTIEKWGILNLVAPLDEMGTSDGNYQQQAEQRLKLYNREYKQISIKAVGDQSCLGGSMVYVDLGIVDNTEIKKYMLVDQATHNFINNQHTMDLQLLDINNLSGA